MTSSAAGMLSHADQSSVPSQSNSRRNRLRSVRSSLAPCEMVSGPDVRLPVAADPEDGAALRRAEPLVGVAGPVGDAGGLERAEVDRHLARRMGAVHEHLEPAIGQGVGKVDDRHDDRGRAGDGAQDDQPGPRPDGVKDRAR